MINYQVKRFKIQQCPEAFNFVNQEMQSLDWKVNSGRRKSFEGAGGS